ncbi:hypothetical protein LTR56_023187 [Elasticomyces elasticus]|nr:hypothetical protein LTR56_023187 [Elasticomyces elasticus]
MTVVGSGLMRMARLSDLATGGSIFQKLNREGEVPMANYYRTSKLLVYYAVKELAIRTPVSSESNVCLTIQTPGICKSDIFRDDVGMLKWLTMGAATAVLARSTEVGARTLVHAVNPKLPVEAHGRFLVDCQIAPEGLEYDSEQGPLIAKKWSVEIWELVKQIESS